MNRRFGSWRRGVTAATTAVAGATTVAGQLSGIALTGRHASAGFSDLPLHALGIAGGLGLLLLTVGLWNGKRRAALVAAAALCLIGLARLAFGLFVLDAAIDLVPAVIILLNLGAFPRGAGGWRSRKLTDTVGLAAGAGIYAVYVVAALGASEGTELDRAVASAGHHLPAGPILAGTASHPGLAINATIALVLVGGWALLRGLLRPAAAEDGHEPAEGIRARTIAREHGSDSLAPFAIREDKAFHFAAGGFVAYRVLRETAVVSGDPVGPPGSVPAILESFVGFAEARGWNVVITAASDRHLSACKQLGLRVLRIGDEAVVDPRTFSLEGRAIRKVRQSIARVKRHGWRVEVVDDGVVSAELGRELAEVEADWRSRQWRLIGFAMTLGRLAGTDDRDGGVYVLGRDADGRLRSFLRFASYRDGLSLDLMRRAGDEPNGLTEALVVAAIEHARELGLSAVSLNFAGFAHVMAADAALSRSQRLLRLCLRLCHGRFQLERLVRFNAKFFPRWQPRYLVYDGLTYLPLSALRVLQAEAYLPAPDPDRRRKPFGGAPGWLRGATAAAAICVGLTTSMLLVGGNHATARPLRIHAEAHHSDWSFVYGGAGGSHPGGLPVPAQGPARHPQDRAPPPRTGNSHGSAPPRRHEHPMWLRPRRDLGRRPRAKAVPLPTRPRRIAQAGPRSAAVVRWRLALALALAFLATGIYGAYAYVHNYSVYRGFPPPSDPHGVPAGRYVEVNFQSQALGHQDRYMVYEPPGFQQLAARGYRFPVLYLLHGTVSNALHYINVGRVGVNLDELLAAGRIRPFLIVMPESSDGTFIDDTEWANTSHGSYESAVMNAVQQVDQHWPTIAKRSARAIAGLSMGGYGALNIGLHHLDTFGTIESWSGYYKQTRTGVFANATPAQLSFNSPAAYAKTIRPALQRLPLRVFLYSGAQDHLTHLQPGFAQELRRLGATVRTAEPPGVHDWRLWRTEMPAALRIAGNWLYVQTARHR